MSLRLIAFLMVSIAAAFAIDVFGFGIAHSAFLGIVTFLVSPGLLVIFASERLGSTVSWPLLVLLNVIYYEVIYRVARWMRRERS